MAQRTGIDVRHKESCASRAGGRCNCQPTYQASVCGARESKRIRKLVPVDELERIVAEQRRPARGRPEPANQGRPRVLASDLVDHILTEREAGRTLREIAAQLNERVPTAHGGAPWWPSTVRAVIQRSAD